MALSVEQGSLRSLTFGRDTDWPGIGGTRGALGTPQVPGSDVATPSRHGAVGGLDRRTSRVILIPFQVLGSTTAAVQQNLATLRTAWKETDDELPLTLRFEDTPELVYFGRPRGLDDGGLGKLISGTAKLVGTFACQDPYVYRAPISTASGSATATATNAGDTDSERYVLTIVGNGGTPTVTNVTTGDSWTFAAPLSGTATLTLTPYSLRLYVASATGGYFEHLLAPTSAGFDLAPGANVIVVTGATSVSLDYRSCYQ